MRRALIGLNLAILTSAGCGPNAYTVNSQNQAMLQQQQAVVQQTQELEQRAQSLDRDNQELESVLAQSRQQIQLLKDQLAAVRDELRTTSNKLAMAEAEKQDLRKQTTALAASVKSRTAASIKPNNSLVGRLTAIHLPGVEVRQDGDVVRIELPADRLFHSGTATVRPDAAQLLDSVVADVTREYPEQIIGIEGHTDSQPLRSAQFRTRHELSTAQAMAVYSHMTSRLSVPEAQLFIVGQGANHPVVSNATAAGQTRNRRIELVIYPEKF